MEEHLLLDKSTNRGHACMGTPMRRMAHGPAQRREPIKLMSAGGQAG